MPSSHWVFLSREGSALGEEHPDLLPEETNNGSDPPCISRGNRTYKNTWFNYTRSMIRKYRLIIDIQKHHMYTSTIAKCMSVWFSHSPFFCFLLDFFKNLKTTSFTGTVYTLIFQASRFRKSNMPKRKMLRNRRFASSTPSRSSTNLRCYSCRWLEGPTVGVPF